MDIWRALRGSTCANVGACPRTIASAELLSSSRDAVNSALAAVRACSPYPFASDPIAADHYDMWREQRYHFSAR
jgi:hypothetical protein